MGVQPITIEYVCSGNHGRSPIAAAIARQHSKKLLAENRLVIQSSGTWVSKIREGALPLNALLPAVDKALTRGLFTEFKDEYIIAMAKRALESNGMDDIALRITIARMADFEECHRNIIISELTDPKVSIGSMGEPHVPRQLVVSEETNYVLGMGAKNKKEALEIYAGASSVPLIATLGEFAGRPNVQIADAFGGTLQEFRDVAEEMMPLVRRSVELMMDARTGEGDSD